MKIINKIAPLQMERGWGEVDFNGEVDMRWDSKRGWGEVDFKKGDWVEVDFKMF